MRIILPGTGADHCIPAFRCTCGTCTEARQKKGKHIRQNSCLIIESRNGEYLLIDMPPQIMTMISQNEIDDSRINTVLITHRHEDHTLGTRYLFQASARKKFQVSEPVNLFIPGSALRSLSKKLLSEKEETTLKSRKDFYNITTISAGESFTSGSWNITALETGHLSAKSNLTREEESLAYVIEDNDKRVCVYFLDAAVEIPEPTLKYLKRMEIDCLIADCTYEETTITSGHMDIAALMKLKEKLKPERTIASHISHMNLCFTDLENRLAGKSIEISYDGMAIEI